MSEESAIQALIKYRNDPISFAEDLDGIVLDEWQREVLTALRDDHFVAVRSGSGVGKTFLLSVATRWFLFTHHQSKVPTTAPSQHQLYDILWAEHFRWIDRSSIQRQFFDWTQTKLGVKGHAPAWFAVARTAQVKPGGEIAEGLQGFHDAKNLLFIIDEASGVPDPVFAAVEGALTTSNVYVLLAGNPTRRSGFFYDVFNNPKMRKFFKLFHISSEESPRVTQNYVDMMEARYGRDHPIFQIKVLGEFPEADENILVPPNYIETMRNTSKTDSAAFPIEIGVDIGRSGAAAVSCTRQGLNILEWDERIKRNRVTDTIELTQWITDKINDFNPSYVKIDTIGIGAGVYDNLKLVYGDMILPVIGNAAPITRDDDPNLDSSKRYLNLRAQGYWELRDLTSKIYSKKWPDRLLAELGSIRTKVTPSGKIKIESKEEMLQRAMRSPDYADAMYMAFLNPDYCLGELPSVFTFTRHITAVNNDLTKSQGSLWNKTTRFKRGNRWSGLYG